jgi:hypothetical protein
MKQIGKNRRLMTALAGIMFTVLVGSYQANAAWTNKETARVKSLEKKIADLQATLDEMTNNLDSLQTIVNRMESKGDPLVGYKETRVRFLAITDYLGACPSGTSSAERFSETFAIQTRPWLANLSKFDDYKRIQECAVLVLSK